MVHQRIAIHLVRDAMTVRLREQGIATHVIPMEVSDDGVLYGLGGYLNLVQ